LADPNYGHRGKRTLKQGSWLDVAKIFLSILAKQRLDQRIGSITDLQSIIASWQASKTSGKVNWRFTTADTRIKQRRLSPSLQ